MLITYCVNDRPFYMFMALNSLKMLRQHSNLPVHLTFIPGCQHSQAECGCFCSTEEFFQECANLGVTIDVQPYRQVSGEENYFPINKTYLSQLDAERVLFVDVDTFIFGDVASLFDKYSDVDVCACRNRWVVGKRFDNRFLTTKRDVAPFNSGIMLFNNGWHHRRFDQWGNLVRELREGNSELSRWMHEQGCIWNREEMAISQMIADSEATYRYFDEVDAYNVFWPKDLEEVSEHLVAHVYTENWKKVYNKLRGTTTDKKIRARFFSKR